MPWFSNDGHCVADMSTKKLTTFRNIYTLMTMKRSTSGRRRQRTSSVAYSWKDEYPGQITIRIKRDAPGNLAPLPLTSGHQTDGYHTSSQSGRQSGSSSDRRHGHATKTAARGALQRLAVELGWGTRITFQCKQQRHVRCHQAEHWPTGGSQVGSGGSVSSERHYVTTNSGSGSQYNPRGYSGVHSERRVGYPYANAGSIPYGAGVRHRILQAASITTQQEIRDRTLHFAERLHPTPGEAMGQYRHRGKARCTYPTRSPCPTTR
ncbi:hypothetical protein ScPMuIL_015469 [Solemya velum]